MSAIDPERASDGDGVRQLGLRPGSRHRQRSTRARGVGRPAAAMLVLLMGVGAGSLPAAPGAGAAGVRSTPLPAMAAPRAVHQALRLANGDVLIMGGCDTAGCDHATDAVELYDPARRAFRAAPPMQEARNGHAAIVLGDGRVLVAGGWVDGRTTSSVELFDPATGAWRHAAALDAPRGMATLTALDDGRLLLAGGSRDMEPLATAAVFDPRAERFVATAPMRVARSGHAAVRLRDGRVLVTGGQAVRRGPVLASAEVYDPRSGSFEPTGDLRQARFKHAAVLLADGRVALIGGADSRDGRGRLRSIEYYDPGSGRFEAGPDLVQPRYKLPGAAVLLRSGKVLVAGGAPHPELLDPVAGKVGRLDDDFGADFQFATATVLDDGAVLVVGGYDGRLVPTASAWLVHAGGDTASD